MMKPHCDRCEELIDVSFPFTSWLEEGTKEDHNIWHININYHKNQQFCKDCTALILKNYLAILK